MNLLKKMILDYNNKSNLLEEDLEDKNNNSNLEEKKSKNIVLSKNSSSKLDLNNKPENNSILKNNFNTDLYSFSKLDLNNSNKDIYKSDLSKLESINQNIIKDFYDKKTSVLLNYDKSIRNIRLFNNKVKMNLFETYIDKNDIILDIGIGKGGDLDKYQMSNISFLYACDISKISILEAEARYNLGFKRGKSNYTFNHEFIELNVSNQIYPNIINLNIDMCISMFVIHYFFESKNSFKNFLKTINCSNANKLLFITLNSNKIIDIINKKNLNLNKSNKVDLLFMDKELNDTNKNNKNKLINSKNKSLLDIEYLPNLNKIDIKKDNKSNLEEEFFDKTNKDKQKYNPFGKQYRFILGNNYINCIEFLVDEEYLIKSLNKLGYNIIINESIINYSNSTHLNKEEKQVIDLYNVYYFSKNI